MVTIRSIAQRGLATFAALTIIASLTACGSNDSSDTNAPSASVSASVDLGSAAVFLPSDGVTLSQHTPVNKWSVFGNALHDALVKQGFAKRDVVTVKTDKLSDQAQEIEDYLNDLNKQQDSSSTSASASTSGSASTSPTASSTEATKKRHTTLIVAPLTTSDDTTRQYGDYVTLPADADSTSSEDKKAERKSQEEAAGEAAMIDVLNKASDEGMSVILVSNTLEGYVPDAFVSMSDAKQIGRQQAKQLVSKLALSRATKQNPRSIEIMLPNNNSDAFAKEAFAGIWEVLRPYFASGAAVCPSGLLNEKSDANSWQAVTFKANDQNAVEKELTHRLGMDSDSSDHPSIDGIIAMNDFVAYGVTSALNKLHYTGSSADINPQISIGGIVNNMVGNKDLKKSPVPDPTVSPTTPTSSPSSGQTDTNSTDSSSAPAADDPAWPIVTGYGAYATNLPSIVDGKQWSTTMEDRFGYASDTAQVAEALNRDKKITTIAKSQTTISKTKVPTVKRDLIEVSASNLKKAIIDPGYASAADAGL